MKPKLDGMIRNGEIGEMIAVFIDGGNSWYVGEYEPYIARDLVQYVDGHYRTIPHRSSRGITGYSMGGIGAMHLALKFPEVFAVTVPQAGGYWRGYPRPSIEADLGRYVGQSVRLNGIKIVHGSTDGTAGPSAGRILAEKLTDLGLDHLYAEHGGGHIFIDEESLLFLSDHLHPLHEIGRLREAVSGTTTPSNAVFGQTTQLSFAVKLNVPPETAESVRRIILDLSSLGIPSSLSLAPVGGGRYAASTTVTPPRSGLYDLPVLVETTQGERYRLLSVPLTVWPTTDLAIFDEGLTNGGEVSARSVEHLDPNQTDVVFAGSSACAVEGKNSFAGWAAGFPFASTGGLGYRFLRFAFHPGEATLSGGDRFSVAVTPGTVVNLLEHSRVDMARREWQVVEIPLGLFETDEPHSGVNFSGNFGGVFYLDAVELVLWPDVVEDLVILGDALAPGWEIGDLRLEHLAPIQTDVVHAGISACAVQGKESFAGWAVKFQPADPVYPFDYQMLRFAVHPGETTRSKGERFYVTVAPGEPVSLPEHGRVDMTRKEWQLVEIPLTDFAIEEPIESVTFSGFFSGTFYLDDLVLGGVEVPLRSPTAVREERLDAMPRAFTLQQNFPNPFNSETVIRFALRAAEEAELALFNLTGQRVATLMQGWRPAGTYTVRWDGRDDGGRELGAGVYLYRLQASEQIEMRKLLLLR